MPAQYRLHAARVLFVLCLLGLAAFYLDTAREVFPPPFTDSPPHLIPTLNYKAGHGFGGVYFALTRTYDPTGAHRFLQYPPLFHLVVAGLIRRPTVEAAYLCLGWLSVAALTLCAGLMWQGSRDLPATRRSGWVLLAALGLFAVSTWLAFEPAAGRPEALTGPLILLAALVLLRTPLAWQPLTAGVFVGLVTATQVVNGILLGLLFAIYASLPGAGEARPRARWWAQCATAAAIGLAVFAGCLALGPHPLGETLRGIVVHAQRLTSIRYAVVTNYLSPSPGGSFFGLFFGAVLAGFLWQERRRMNLLTGVNVGLLLAVVWYFAIRASDLCYNVFAFVPLLAALVLRSLARLDPGDSRGAARARRVGYGWAAVIFALMSVGLLRQGLAFGLYKAYGVSFAEAKQRFAQLVPPEQPIYVVPPLWPLATRLDHIYLDQPDRAGDPGYMPEKLEPWLVLHQWYGRSLTPPELPGYRLVWDDYQRRPTPCVFGFQASATTPGYAFALYEPR